MPEPSPRHVYRGEHLRAVAMPLGGIGTGTISLCGDGSLRQWQIHNQVNHLACIPHSFFAVWARRPRADEVPVARILQSRALYDTKGLDPPPTSNDHLVPLGALTAVSMSTARLPEDDDGYGSMALAALSPDARYLTQWDRLETFWSEFSASGRLSNGADTTPSAAGRTWNAALAVPVTL